MSNIKERILEISDFKNITKEFFFKEIGSTYANFKGKAKKTPLNSNIIANIMTIFPEINIEWLISGKGERLKKNEAPMIDNENAISHAACKNEQQHYELLIKSMQKTIDSQSENLNDLRQLVHAKNLEIERLSTDNNSLMSQISKYKHTDE